VARVDFYVLKAPGAPARNVFACRLAEKAYRLDNAVHIQTADESLSRELDDLLWTFRDGSFVPHEILAAEPDGSSTPVTIGARLPAARQAELLINLSADIPEAASNSQEECPRIAEIVSGDDDSRRQSRERYARYRELGHTLETHKLS